MNTRHFITCILAILTVSNASLGFAGQAQPYRYGQKLDVQKVISLKETPSKKCQVVDATMVYLDSNGSKRTVTYRRLSDVCSKQH